MRIPDGDLVPARRHRYRGGYGRSRLLRRRRAVAAVVLAVVAAAAVAWYVARDEKKVSLAQACPSASPSAATGSPASAAALPAPAQVRLALLNGTPRNGLAAQVGAALTARGFVVVSQGNAPTAVAGPAIVSYGRGASPAATVLARHVHGSRVVAAPRARAGTVQLVLGGDYRRLSTPAEVSAAAARPSPTAVPSPTQSRTQSPCVP